MASGGEIKRGRVRWHRPDGDAGRAREITGARGSPRELMGDHGSSWEITGAHLREGRRPDGDAGVAAVPAVAAVLVGAVGRAARVERGLDDERGDDEEGREHLHEIVGRSWESMGRSWGDRGRAWGDHGEIVGEHGESMGDRTEAAAEYLRASMERRHERPKHGSAAKQSEMSRNVGRPTPREARLASLVTAFATSSST